MNRISSVTATRKGATKKHGPMRSMRLEKAENGVVSHMEFAPHPDAKPEDSYGPHLSPDPTIHKTAKDLLAHVKKHTAAFFPAAAGAADPGETPGGTSGSGASTPAAEPDEDDEDE